MRFEVRRNADEDWILWIDEAGGGRREVPGRSCDELADAAALVIAVSLSSESSSPVEGTAPAGLTSEPDPENAPTLEVVPASATEADSAVLTGALWAHGGAGFGLSGGPTGLLKVGAGLRRRWLGVDLGVWGSPRTRVRRGGVGVATSLWAAELSLCGGWSSARLEVPVCVVGLAGQMRGRGIGAVESRSVAQAWGGVGGRGALRVRLARSAWLSVTGGPVVVLNRPRFSLDEVGVVCCSERVGGDLSAGFEFRFGAVRNAQ